MFASVVLADNVSFTQGESPTLTITAQSDSAGTAFNITGATIVTKFLQSNGTTELSIADGSHTITNGSSGTFNVELSAADTAQIRTGKNRTFVSIVTLGGKDYYFWARKKLDVYSSAIKDN